MELFWRNFYAIGYNIFDHRISKTLQPTPGTSCHELYRKYCTISCVRESRPFHEEPDTSVPILISTTVLHLECECTANELFFKISNILINLYESFYILTKYIRVL